MPLGDCANTMAATPKATGCHFTTVADVNTDGRAISSTAESTEPPRVAAPAVTRTVSHTSDWKKSKLSVDTDPMREPNSPPPIPATNAARQKTMTRLAVGLIPMLWTASGESPMAARIRPSRVIRTSSTPRTARVTTTRTK